MHVHVHRYYVYYRKWRRDGGSMEIGKWGGRGKMEGRKGKHEGREGGEERRVKKLEGGGKEEM